MANETGIGHRETAEAEELIDPDGLEKAFQKTYVGVSKIPIDNLEVHRDLSHMLMFNKVLKIVDHMRTCFDPSQVRKNTFLH